MADCRVLVMGGVGANGALLASAELYQPATETWTDAGSLSNYREGFTATLPADGRVLVAGGQGPSGYPAQAELYTPRKSAPYITLRLLD